MIKIEKNTDCNGCYACYNACPVRCITMETDKEGFWYPAVDSNKCIKCKQCVLKCPLINKKHKDPESLKIAYAVNHINDKVRKESSSGGVFTAIAEYVLNNGGVVFGVMMDENREIRHSYVDNVNELIKFKTSKYVQSKVDVTFEQAKSFLESGKLVLFTGTPCQIGGLYSYLDKEYDNLITHDIICHGVPSPLIWKYYVKHLEKNSKSRITDVNFRYKGNSWVFFKFKTVFQDGKVRIENRNNNPFVRAFMKNLTLRPSCYDCSFKTKKRQADFTLADFWGVDYIAPEFNDDKGTSLFLVHTEKGIEALEKISNQLKIVKVDYENSTNLNPAMFNSMKLTEKRGRVFDNINLYESDFMLIKEYLPKKQTNFQAHQAKILHSIFRQIKIILGEKNVVRIKKLLGK